VSYIFSSIYFKIPWFYIQIVIDSELQFMIAYFQIQFLFIVAIPPVSQALFSEVHKNDLCDSKNLEMSNLINGTN
jgi:hypothetical protein